MLVSQSLDQRCQDILEVNLDNIVRDTLLTVGEGCSALYLVNGSLQSINTSGTWRINTKEEEKSKAQLRLIGVNSDKLYEIMFGVGGIHYKDWELNIETDVGAHGTFRFRRSCSPVASPREVRS